MNNDSPASSNPPTIFSGTFDDLVSISFTHPLLSLGVTFKELVWLKTLECGIDPVDQSSTTVTSFPLQTPPTPSDKRHPSQGGAAA